METTFDNPNRSTTPQSVDASWRYFKKIWTASSRSEAWTYLKRSIERSTWALVVGIVGLLALVANPAILLLPLAAGAYWLLSTSPSNTPSERRCVSTIDARGTRWSGCRVFVLVRGSVHSVLLGEPHGSIRCET